MPITTFSISHIERSPQYIPTPAASATLLSSSEPIDISVIAMPYCVVRATRLCMNIAIEPCVTMPSMAADDGAPLDHAHALSMP